MSNDFWSIKCIQINGDSYWIHNFILKKMSIFALLFDESYNCHDDIKMNIDNYDSQIMNNVFKMLYNFPDKEFQKLSFDDKIKRLNLIVYFGVDDEIIAEYARYTGSSQDDLELIIQAFIKNQYHESMNLVLDNLGFIINVNDVIKYISRIKEISVPVSLPGTNPDVFSGRVSLEGTNPDVFSGRVSLEGINPDVFSGGVSSQLEIVKKLIYYSFSVSIHYITYEIVTYEIFINDVPKIFSDLSVMCRMYGVLQECDIANKNKELSNLSGSIFDDITFEKGIAEIKTIISDHIAKALLDIK